MKYYYVSFLEHGDSELYVKNFDTAVTKLHPFKFADKEGIRLLFWQEITKKEYDLGAKYYLNERD